MNQENLEKEGGLDNPQGPEPEVLEAAPEARPETEVLTAQEEAITKGALHLEEADRTHREKAFQAEAVLEYLTDGQEVFSQEEILKELTDEVGAENAREILELSQSPLFGHLREEIRRAFPEADENQYLIEVQKGFAELVLAGHFKSQELEKLLSGGVRLLSQEKTGPEEGIPYPGIAKLAVVDGRSTILLYKKFFERQKNEPQNPRHWQNHVIKHEIGHALSLYDLIAEPGLWGKVKEAASKGEVPEDIPPALKGLLESLANPEASAQLERNGSHMQNRFLHLAELQKNQAYLEQELNKFNQKSGENLSAPQFLARVRQTYLEEIVAERVTNYLESDGSLESFLAARFRGVENLSEEDLENQTALFELLQNALDKEKRGEWGAKISAQEFEGDFELFEDYEDLGLPLEMADLNPAVSLKDGKGQVKQRSLFEAVFDFLTGKDKKKIPSSLKKAA